MSTSKTIREKIWTKLRDVARPDTRFHLNFAEVIPDFDGSETATDRIVEDPAYKATRFAFITPDNCLADLRRRMIEDGKPFVMSTYGIYRGFLYLDPATIPEGAALYASWLDGMEHFGVPISLEEIAAKGRFDYLVTGASAVSVNGVHAGTLAYAAGQVEAARLEGLGDLLRVGPNEITLTGGDGNALGYTVAVDYRTRAPRTDPAATIGISTSLDRTTLAMGETVRLRADVRNLTRTGQPMTLARIGIPGGLSAPERQLRALREAGLIDFYETRPLEVALYWRALAPNAARTVELDLVATVPGTWTAPATSAYLYYTPEARTWEDPVRVRVER